MMWTLFQTILFNNFFSFDLNYYYFSTNLINAQIDCGNAEQFFFLNCEERLPITKHKNEILNKKIEKLNHKF